MKSISYIFIFMMVIGFYDRVFAQTSSSIRVGFEGGKGDKLPGHWKFKKWSPVLFGSYEAVAKVVNDKNEKVLYVKSKDSGFLVASKKKLDISKYPVVQWRWKAKVLPKGGHFKKRSTNDQALQLLFGFKGGKVLGYIWDSTANPGDSGSGLAWRKDVRVIVVRGKADTLNVWLSEKRNLYQDYIKLFKKPPQELIGVSVQSNSQHTDSSGEGYVGAIDFKTN